MPQTLLETIMLFPPNQRLRLFFFISILPYLFAAATVAQSTSLTVGNNSVFKGRATAALSLALHICYARRRLEQPDSVWSKSVKFARVAGASPDDIKWLYQDTSQKVVDLLLDKMGKQCNPPDLSPFIQSLPVSMFQ